MDIASQLKEKTPSMGHYRPKFTAIRPDNKVVKITSEEDDLEFKNDRIRRIVRAAHPAEKGIICKGLM